MELCLKYLGVYNVCWIYLSCAHTPGGVRTGYQLSWLYNSHLSSLNQSLSPNLEFAFSARLSGQLVPEVSISDAPLILRPGVTDMHSHTQFSMGTEDLNSGSSFWCSYPLSNTPFRVVLPCSGFFPTPLVYKEVGNHRWRLPRM